MKQNKKWSVMVLAVGMLFSCLTGCGRIKEEMLAQREHIHQEEIQLQVFAAASLNTVMKELAAKYQDHNPGVEIVLNADSSGTLMTQIREGYECDIFFSAAQKQMNVLEEEGFLVEGTRADVVNNQVVVVKGKGIETKVTGLKNIGDAKNIALAAGSVPAGKYTRQAMMKLELLPETEDVSAVSTTEIMESLGTQISEQGNVSKVLIAVAEGACEVGTTYYSDTYGYEDKIEIVEFVDQELTGNVIYPVARVKNPEAEEMQNKHADAFLQYLLSKEAKEVFEKYYFDTDVE